MPDIISRRQSRFFGSFPFMAGGVFTSPSKGEVGELGSALARRASREGVIFLASLNFA